MSQTTNYERPLMVDWPNRYLQNLLNQEQTDWSAYPETEGSLSQRPTVYNKCLLKTLTNSKHTRLPESGGMGYPFPYFIAEGDKNDNDNDLNE